MMKTLIRVRASDLEDEFTRSGMVFKPWAFFGGDQLTRLASDRDSPVDGDSEVLCFCSRRTFYKLHPTYNRIYTHV